MEEIMKVCTKCSVNKPIDMCHKASGGGIQSSCKVCRNEHNRLYAAGRRELEKERAKIYNMLFPEKRAFMNRRWKQNNKGKVNAMTRKRQASQIQRTPAWADDKYIELFYTGAKIEEERTGRKVHVDHIVPLQGKMVCGLHCEDNLQLLFAEDNCSKGNAFG